MAVLYISKSNAHIRLLDLSQRFRKRVDISVERKSFEGLEEISIGLILATARVELCA